MERKVSAVILNVYQSTGIEKEDDSRQSLENHGKLDEIRRLYKKKFEEGHDVHRNLASAENYSRPNKQGEYQYVSPIPICTIPIPMIPIPISTIPIPMIPIPIYSNENMMELEPLLEASGERNLRSTSITYGECLCHCLAQTVWYLEHSNLCLVWDVEEFGQSDYPIIGRR